MLRVLRPDKHVDFVDAPFAPYFFVSRKVVADEELIELIRRSIDDGFEVHEEVRHLPLCFGEEEVCKVSASCPSKLREIRDLFEAHGIQTFEADIPYTRRVTIDLGIAPIIPTKICYFDIEVDPRKGLPRPENPVHRILSIACYIVDYAANTEEMIFLCSDDEREILRRFFAINDSVHVLAGWNSARFDLAYVVERAKRLGLDAEYDLWKLTPHFDLMLLFRRFQKKHFQSYALSYVADKVLSAEIKAKWPEGLRDLGFGEITKIWDWFVSDRDKLYRYNMGQTVLTGHIDREFGLIQTFARMAAMCNLDNPYENPGYSRFVESWILRKASAMRLVFPNTRHRDTKEEYRGGLVFDPVPGIHEFVVVFDLASAYPMSVQTFNVGVDTWLPEPRGDYIEALHGGFTKERRSVFAKFFEEMLQIRNVAKKMRSKYAPGTQRWAVWNARQWGCKFLVMSAYGVMGAPFSRFFVPQVAESLTGYVRDAISLVAEIVRGEGWGRILYGDTDSVFVVPKQKTMEFVERLEDRLCRALVRYALAKNAPEDWICLSIKVDRIFERLLLTTKKKRYAGIVCWEDGAEISPYLHVKGFEAIRGDWPELARWVQRQLFWIILRGTEKDVEIFLSRVKRNLFAGKYDEYLVVYKSLSKPLEEYAVNAQHIKVVKQMLEKGLDVRVGDKIPFIVTARGPIFWDKSAPPKLSSRDYEYMWRKYIVEGVLDKLNWRKNRSILEYFQA